MDASRKVVGCYKNYYNRYYSARLKGDERMYRREDSPLACDAVRSFWKPGEGLSKHRNRRSTLSEKYHKKFPRYWKNQSDGSEKPERSFRRANPWVHPTTADKEKSQPYRERVTTSTSRDKQKQRDLRIIIKNNALKRLRAEKGASFRRANPWVQPTKADKEKSQPYRERVTTSTSRDTQKQRDLRIIIKNNALKRFRAEKEASYGYKSKLVKPEPSTAVASGWARGARNDHRALILSERAHRKSKAGDESRVMTLKQRPHEQYHYSTSKETGVTVNSSRDISGGAVSAKEFKNVYDADHNSIPSEAMFQTRQKRLKSEHSFKEHRVVSGTKITLIRNGEVDSNNIGDTLTGPARVAHTQIKISAEIRVENNTQAESISRRSVLMKTLRVFDCLPQKLACKNTEAEDNFRCARDGNKFRMPASNPDEKDRLQKTKESGKGGIDIYEELLTGDVEDNDILSLDTDENILREIDDLLTY
jgi:hypothetical protein